MVDRKYKHRSLTQEEEHTLARLLAELNNTGTLRRSTARITAWLNKRIQVKWENAYNTGYKRSQRNLSQEIE